MDNAHQSFQRAILRLTAPLNGQYPRPWMSDLTDPLSASLFIVGKNQAKGYSTANLSHQRHMDALFNRAGESCRGLYEEMVGSPSPTRINTDHFRAMLSRQGVLGVLETNVVCYSTPMSNDLRLPEHKGGSSRGTEIFRELLRFVQPKVLIAHGAGTAGSLSRLLGVALPAPPKTLTIPQATVLGDLTVFVIPSLAPPMWNQWSKWADPYLTNVVRSAASAL